MSDRMRAYVALGSNLGNRADALCRARRALAASPSIRIVAASRIFETDPVGPAGQGPYLNAVLALDTGLDAFALLERLLAIERELGRDRAGETERWGPRVIDLDLLLHGDACIDAPGLEVPHPRLHERGFVLEPLCELAPDLVHPKRGETMASYRARVRDEGEVRPWCGSSAWPVGPVGSDEGAPKCSGIHVAPE